MTRVFRTGLATCTRRGLASVILLAAALRASAQCLPEQVQRLTASDAAANDNLGTVVAIDRDTLLVASQNDDTQGGANSGSVYVFVRTNGVWQEQAHLIASDAAANDGFGGSLALAGDIAVIGASVDDHAAGVDAGAVYVFTRSGTNWTQHAKLTASDAAAGDRFGRSVGISGDTLIIGTEFDDAVGPRSGSVYAFVRSHTNGIWIQAQKVTGDDTRPDDRFGARLALSGDTFVAAAGFHDGAVSDSGAAYVFVHHNGSWTQQAKLTQPTPRENDHFGIPAISGDTIAIGMAANSSPGPPAPIDGGAVFIFDRSGDTWTQTASLITPGGVVADNFGDRVCIAGDTLIVSASNDDLIDGEPHRHEGSAYIFTRTAAAWSLDARVNAANAPQSGHFGIGVAISGETALIGSYLEDHAGGPANAGAAYTFDLHIRICTGDVTCDGRVDFFDIDPFLLAVFDPPAYVAAWPDCEIANADLNADTLIDLFDIDPFVACLFGTCP